MGKLNRLKGWKKTVYNWDKKNKELKRLGNEQRCIVNYSGGIDLGKVQKLIKPIKQKNYKILNIPIGGDAPKDFIQVYEYEQGVFRSKLSTWNKYIAKIGHKWYPLESVSEYLLNQLGVVLGLNMALSKLRIIDNQIRFLSKYFLKKNENLIHGAQIYSSYLEENNTAFVDEIEKQQLTKELLTFQFTMNAIKSMFSKDYSVIMEQLVTLLVFDGIIGNNDRHFYNWGIITDIEGLNKPIFSPIYDTARGLFWNVREEKIEQKYYQKEKINKEALEKYIKKSCPKMGWEKEKNLNHIDLIKLIYQNHPEYRLICEKLLNDVSLQKIKCFFKINFEPYYTIKRFNLIERCLEERFRHLQKVCNLC